MKKARLSGITRRLLILMFIVLVGAVAVLFGQNMKSDADLKAEIENKLQGKWKATSAIYDGKQTKIQGLFVTGEIEFSNGNFKSWSGGKEFFGIYELNTSKDPMWIDLAYDGNTAKPFQGTSFRGVFEIAGDTLTIVTNVQRRPKELSAKSTSLNLLIEYERVEKSD